MTKENFDEKMKFGQGPVDFNFTNNFLKILIEKLSLESFWVDIENAYYDELISLAKGSSNFYSKIQDLNRDFERIQRNVFDLIDDESKFRRLKIYSENYKCPQLDENTK